MTQAVAEVAPESVTGTDIVVPGDNHPLLRAMVQNLRTETEDLAVDSDVFVMDLMEQILAADTVEDIFAAQEAGLLSGKDFTNRPFLLKEEDIIVVRSNLRTGFPFYARMQVTEIGMGEPPLTLACGGKTFMAVLLALRTKGYFKTDKAYPEGKPLVLIATESGDGAYLSLRPFAGYRPANASAKK